MGILNFRKKTVQASDTDESSSSVEDGRTQEFSAVEKDSTGYSSHEVSQADPRTSLHRGLKARHITMIAIGGALGTGLIIGTGKALAQSGPASILISYSVVGFLVYMVMCGLGEMAAWLPLASGFTGYATRFCDPALGFALGWVYWFKYIIITPNQLTAAALVIQYWIDRETVNPGVWIAIFLVVIICINYFGGVKFFGEFEFWLSSAKVLIICGVILLCLVLACGGGPNGEATGFRYYHNPGAFNTYLEVGSLGKFCAFWSSFVNAVFAYLGTELVGVTVGEAQNPRKNIPKAIKLTFFRILFFYMLSVFLLGMIVPYDSNQLVFATQASTSAAASPFVVAIKLAGIGTLDHILNACILLFVFSASNSDLYIATRTLYGLAAEGSAPKIFMRTDKQGVPYVALAMSAVFALLAFLNVADDSAEVFVYFVNLVSILGLMAWISLLTSHIFFVRARRAQGIPDSSLAYKAPLGIWGSYVALFFCCLIALTKNYDVFVLQGEPFDYETFITGYLGIPVFLILLFGYKLIKRTKTVKPHEADFYSGKEAIDREEEEFVAQQKEKMQQRRAQGKFVGWYKFISWLF